MRKRKTQRVSKPGTGSLLASILKGICTDGMQVPSLLCVGASFALYHEKLPHYEIIAALLIGSIVLIGLFRGCANWQQELGDYQRELVIQRHQVRQADPDKGATIPGFIPYTHR